MMKKVAFGLSIAFLTVALSGCVDEQSKSRKVTESQKAEKRAANIKFTENAEIENIEKRLKLTSDPGLIGYVVLLNEMGLPILYTGVTGKITSGGKRLTSDQRMVRGKGGSGYTKDFVMKAPSDEGTWGSSNPYVYFWDTNGRYYQWNRGYLYSDNPIRLSKEPLVIVTKNDTKSDNPLVPKAAPVE